jgi:hypothetical protein
MDGDDCFGAGSDCPPDSLRRHVLAVGINVHADGLGAAHDTATRGSNECARRGDNFISTFDPECLQRRFESDRTICQTDGVLDANRLGKLIFKQSAFLTRPVIDFSGF